MPARNRRRSASYYMTAALLEFVIMAMFVVIAQPHLRQVVIDAIDPPNQTLGNTSPTLTQAINRPSSNNRTLAASSSFDSSMTDLDELTDWAIGSATLPVAAASTSSALMLTPPSLLTPSAAGMPSHTRASSFDSSWHHTDSNYAQSSQLAHAHSAGGHDRNVLNHVASYTPSTSDVARGSQSGYQSNLPAPSGYGALPANNATQLNSYDWNVAAAAQSARPLSGWNAASPAPEAYRDVYPPPFGTQSQWK